jgi:crotonobetainyl-CoA:carnitine CoA-transferase CaiB-like acyl-CoA transferase
MGSVFVGANRNKASLVLDLKTDSGRLGFRELATRADVLVHNMRLRATRSLGIDYESLRENCPNLVYCSITGFGSKGPYNDRPAYDDIIQAESGLVWLQSLGSDSPRYVATAIGDKTAGMVAANAVMAALVHRSHSGCGQHVEVPMFETLAGYVLLEQLGGRAFVPSLGPTGYSRMRSVHRRPYETMDGFISVVVYNEGHWRRFLDHVGHGDLLDTEKFATVASRNTHIDELYELLANVLTERTTGEWLITFEALDIPAGRVVSPDDLFDDAHLNAVDFFFQTGAADAQFVAPRSPVIFSATPVHYGSEATPPPTLGSGESAAKRWLQA